jgi:spermidine/putrescine transport system substrate-binding protein
MMKPITRRHFVASATALGGALAMPATIGRAQSAGELNILGTNVTEPNGPLIKKFMQETGIKVNVRGSTETGMHATILSQEQEITDLINNPSQGLWSIVKLDLLQPIDDSRLDGLDRINPIYVTERDLFNGKRIAVPMALSWAMLATRTTEVPEKDAESWAAVFENKYAGRVTLRPGGALQAALAYIGKYDAFSKYTGDEPALRAALKEARDFIIARKKNYLRWYEEKAEVQQMFAADEIAVAHSLMAIAVPLAQNDSTIRARTPKEGAQGNVRNLSIVKNAKNLDNAYKFINFMLKNKDTPAMVARWSGGPSTFKDSTTGLTEKEALWYQYSDDILGRILVSKTYGPNDNKEALVEEYIVGMRDA